jgi:hypothetical protein
MQVVAWGVYNAGRAGHVQSREQPP